MKQVTQQACTAFNNGRQWRKDNTEVFTAGSDTFMTLYNNPIARRSNGKVFVSHAGWRTNTTKERLNGLPGVNIVQKNFVWFLNGQPMNDGWNLIE